jgi:hypothetical protein
MGQSGHLLHPTGNDPVPPRSRESDACGRVVSFSKGLKSMGKGNNSQKNDKKDKKPKQGSKKDAKSAAKK